MINNFCGDGNELVQKWVGMGIDCGFRCGWAVWEWVGMGMDDEIGAEL